MDDSTGPFSARMSGTEPQRTSKLLTETDEFRESQLSFDQSTETGQETLEEAADKSRFFKKLHADAEGTVDYSQLNKQLGQTENTSFFETADVSETANVSETPDDQGGTMEESFQVDEEQEMRDKIEEGRPGTYMGEEPPEEEIPEVSARPNLLANVSLNDTLDTSLQATSAHAADVSGGMGNTSQLEYEAVQQAYQEVHDKEGTQTIPFTSSVPAHETDRETDGNEEEVPAWQNTSRREAESEGTSVWDLQPVAETKDATLHDSEQDSKPSSPSSGRRSNSSQAIPKQRQQPSVWDLEPVSQAEAPPELTPIGHSSTNQQREHMLDEVDWRGGKVTPPTAMAYETIDQLSPIAHDREFDFPVTRDSQTNTPTKRSLKKSMARTQIIRRPVSAGKSSTDKFGHVKSSGYGVVHTTPSRNRSSSPKARSAKKATKKKSSPSSQKSTNKDTRESEQLLPVESSPIKVLQSVESFANYLRDQFVSSTPASKPVSDTASGTHVEREAALLNEIREWQQKWREECRMREKVAADFASAQKHWERYAEETRLKHEQELGSLRQQVYILEAKASLRSGPEPTAEEGGGSPHIKETIARLESEIRSQDKLLSGYQLENEKLYKEMKQMDSLHKSTYERLYQENHKQASELAQLREALSQREAELKMKGLPTIGYGHPSTGQLVGGELHPLEAGETTTPMTAALGAGRIADLKTQLVKAKSDSGSFAAQVTVLSQNNSSLSSQLDQVCKERDQLKELLMISKQPAEIRAIQERYQQEINVLEKRIRWYIDNQKILDSDLEKLRQKDCEINQLKNNIKQLEEQKHRSYDSKQRAKDRAADTKRIKDLERQVKEMEQIVRKRNPNSIPSLIWAASIMPDNDGARAPSIKFLEERVAQLEKELEEKDEETTRILRSMEQQCNRSKALYEQRIEELEKGQSRGDKSNVNRHTTVYALEKDLQAAKEQHKKKQNDLQLTIDSLREELTRLQQKDAADLKSATRALRQSKEQSQSHSHELEVQLQQKMEEIASLHGVVDRLQKEKRQLLVELNHVQSVSPNKPDAVRSQQSPKKSVEGRTRVITGDRQTDEDLTRVVSLNKQLVVKYEEAQIEVSQLRVSHQRQLAKLESEMRQQQSDTQALMKRKELELGREVEQLKARLAVKQSDSELSKYKNEISSLETLVGHLKEDRQRWQHDTEELSALRIRNITLDSRIKCLEDQLEDAKETHSPEMRHFERLKDKISSMEERFSARESELKRVITQNQVTYHEDLRLEVHKWKSIVHSKNKDIERFRGELDSILGILKELRRQGVTIPLT
ncbi:centrosomal protein of 162 kDa-like [Watersipora subatra]|uniref:centrosomal protein of 162 kDa-like n=1 Tax=Watersipora subatra TaxID=2589382 RepID=UPI00355C20B5